MKGARRRAPRIYFTMEKTGWGRRYAITARMGSWSSVVARTWQWDKADDLVEKLNEITQRPGASVCGWASR